MMINVMLITNISEEPDLALWCEHSHAQSMDRSITKAFVVEAARVI